MGGAIFFGKHFISHGKFSRSRKFSDRSDLRKEKATTKSTKIAQKELFVFYAFFAVKCLFLPSLGFGCGSAGE